MELVLRHDDGREWKLAGLLRRVGRIVMLGWSAAMTSVSFVSALNFGGVEWRTFLIFTGITWLCTATALRGGWILRSLVGAIAFGMLAYMRFAPEALFIFAGPAVVGTGLLLCSGNTESKPAQRA